MPAKSCTETDCAQDDTGALTFRGRCHLPNHAPVSARTPGHGQCDGRKKVPDRHTHTGGLAGVLRCLHFPAFFCPPTHNRPGRAARCLTRACKPLSSLPPQPLVFARPRGSLPAPSPACSKDVGSSKLQILQILLGGAPSTRPGTSLVDFLALIVKLHHAVVPPESRPVTWLF